MVKTVHLCEICGQLYSGKDDAKKCESKGYLGPEIKPDLLLTAHDNFVYYLFIKTLKNTESRFKSHHRDYVMIGFSAWKTKPRQLYLDIPTIDTETFAADELKKEFQNKSIKICSP